MQTRNGTKVKHVKFIPETNSYVGLLKGKLFVWDINGRHTSKRKTKHDLVFSYFFNVTKWGQKIVVQNQPFTSVDDAIAYKPKGYIKTIEVTL